MPLELTSFALKLRRYREQFAVSVDQLSAGTGIAADVVAALEAGGRRPTGDEVLILADYFKCDYKFFVSNEQLAAIDQTEKLFRRFGEELSAPDRWAIQEFLFLCENEAFLTIELGRAAAREFSFTKVGTFYKGHGVGAAEELRRFLGYSATQIPVDVFDDFRTIGVHVFRRHLENSNISGMFLKHPTAGKCVLVNYSEDVYRQRFTGAHEAGHAILDDGEDFVVSFKKWEKGDLVETRANTFAAHYLVPPEYVARMPAIEWTPTAVIDVAQKMRVNVDVLVIALQRDGRIDASIAATFKGLKIPRHQKVDPEMSSSLTDAGRAQKIVLLERGLSTHYVRLCFDAYEQGVVSAGRVAEMLLADERDLLNIGALYGWTPKHGA
jgi:Zn-dependent peptidase ImmA (M78 family)/transcriptional regulator with XRE-family HTH domain